jgi:hypothetical protein
MRTSPEYLPSYSTLALPCERPVTFALSLSRPCILPLTTRFRRDLSHFIRVVGLERVGLRRNKMSSPGVDMESMAGNPTSSSAWAPSRDYSIGISLPSTHQAECLSCSQGIDSAFRTRRLDGRRSIIPLCSSFHPVYFVPANLQFIKSSGSRRFKSRWIPTCLRKIIGC